MNTQIPSTEDVRLILEKLSMQQLRALSDASGVPWTTIYKIKLGNTPNPGIETVRLFLPHLSAVVGEAKAA
jgi:predicted transcriptional regulator